MKSSLRTLHINTEITWRGGEQLTLELLRGLRQRGHIAHLIAQPKSRIREVAEQEGFRVYPVAMRGEWDLLAAWKIQQIAKKGKYQILHSHTPHAHTLAGLASFFLPPVLRLTDKRTDFSIYRHSFLGLNWIKYHYLIDLILAESKKIHQVLLEDGVSPKKVRLVYEGVNPNRFAKDTPKGLEEEFPLPPHSLKIGNVAHFADHKGQVYLIQAIPKVLQQFPKAYFFLVGDGELRPPLMKLAKELNIQDHVFFPGFRKDIGRFLKWFDLFVISSHLEGLCTSILDAFLQELPVVATNTGGIPEIVRPGETGRLARPKDPEDLAKEICLALQDLPKMREMAKRGKAMVLRQFTTDHMVENTLKVYYEGLQRKGILCTPFPE